jgi:hypothetical protein
VSAARPEPVDPLVVACAQCGALRGARCVRLDSVYGRGQPLRRMHTARFRAARAALERRRDADTQRHRAEHREWERRVARQQASRAG